MINDRQRGRWLVLAALLALSAGPLRAAQQFLFFFGDHNNPATLADDELVVKPIFWADDSEPIEFLLSDFLPFFDDVLLPDVNTNLITDFEILDGMTRALEKWAEASNLDVFDSPILASFIGLGGVDAGFDLRNIVTFQSVAVTLGDGVLGLTSFFFMEEDWTVEDFAEFLGLPIDRLEGPILVPVDVDLDGFIDFEFPVRDLRQGELLDADVIMNSTLEWFQWPEDFGDIPDSLKPLVPGSLDIESVLIHELGHALGVGHTWLIDATMTPFFFPPGTLDFVTDPFEVRKLKFDDRMGLALTYGGGGGGAITGSIIDGAFVDDDPATLAEDPFVVMAQVFLGVPAEVGLPARGIPPLAATQPHPDVIQSARGRIRLVANVSAGQNLRYPTSDAFGIVNLEPGLGLDTTLTPFDPFAPPTGQAQIDSIYRFVGLPAGNQYVVYIDPAVTLTTGVDPTGAPIAINDAIFNLGPESGNEAVFIPEFFGGTTEDAVSPDTFSADDNPSDFAFVTVVSGRATTDIDIVTNTSTAGGIPVTPPPADGTLGFIRVAEGFPTSSYVVFGADKADINGDGFLDLAVAVFAGGGDVGGVLNRIFLNVPITPSNPAAGRKFEDVTFGRDGIPGTADDRLPPQPDQSRDVKFGDFNRDGWPDIFVSNAANVDTSTSQGGFNRLYINRPLNVVNGVAGDFRFEDVSEFVLPGLLNRGWNLNGINPRRLNNPTDVAGGGFFGTGPSRDQSIRAAVGDIDGDGDLDIIVSLLVPYPDLGGAASPFGGASSAAIDAQPSAMGDPGDDLYDNTMDPAMIFPGVLTEALGFFERVLVNYNLMREPLPSFLPVGHPLRTDPTNNGLFFVFLDETLGADMRFGDSTDLSPAALTLLGIPPSRPPFFGGNFELRPNTDRMPPSLGFHRVVAMPGFTYGPNAPMGVRAFEPRLGGIFPGGPDLVSARAWNTNFVGVPNFQSDSAYFINVDFVRPTSDGSGGILFRQDGIPDGYFANVNYGLDFQSRNGSGWFPRRTLTVTVPGPLGDEEVTTVVLERQPLLLGLPDGFAADIGGTPPELDAFPVQNRTSYAAVIGDWEYRGAAFPLQLHDPTLGGSFGTLFFPTGLLNATTLFHGAQRMGVDLDTDTGIGGYGMAFQRVPDVNFVTSLFPLIPGGGATLSRAEVPIVAGVPPAPPILIATHLRGEVNHVAVADLDLDGDFDVVTAEAVLDQFSATGGVNVNSPSAFNRVILNANDVQTAQDTNGFGTFLLMNEEDDNNNAMFDPTEDHNGNGVFDVGGAFFPILRRLTFSVLADDFDNDGDVDIVFFNALGAHDYFRNTLVFAPPNLNSADDVPLFVDQTPRYLPPYWGGSIVVPIGGSQFAGITTAAATADLNADGRPDLITTEGGVFALGDFPVVLLNTGPRLTDATKIFTPLGAPYPAPRINASPFGCAAFIDDANNPLNGYVINPAFNAGAYFDVAVGDFDGNGSPDLIFSRNGEGPEIYFNYDSAAALPIVQQQKIDRGEEFFDRTTEACLNALPDDDDAPDAILVEQTADVIANGGRLVDPFSDPNNEFQLKRLGRRLAAADFNNDGRLDVAIANGLQTVGAPNVLLLNRPIGPAGTFFEDATESKLPLNVIDNTYVVAVGDFDHDGDIDIIFANEAFPTVDFPNPVGFRFLRNRTIDPNPALVEEARFVDVAGVIPTFPQTRPRYIIVADFDRLGEPGEDSNGNGILDPGEDVGIPGVPGTAGNGALDFVDLPTEVFEDLNCNGVLDPGEDLNGNGRLDASEDLNGNGVLDTEDIGIPGIPGTAGNGVLDTEDLNGNGILDPGEDRNGNLMLDTEDRGIAGIPGTAGNGRLDFEDTDGDGVIDGGDKNGDGILTCRVLSRWEPSWDLFITFEGQPDRILMNDPTGQNAGRFTDQTATRLPAATAGISPASMGARAGDVDLDGDLDIVIAKGNGTVQLLINTGRGFFVDRSSEIPLPSSRRTDVPDSFSDVVLLDADGDGDLDLFVANRGDVSGLPNLGGINAFYVNRRVGANLNAARVTTVMNPPPGSPRPRTFAADPPWSAPGRRLLVRLSGENYTPQTVIDFMGKGVDVLSTTFRDAWTMEVEIEIDVLSPIGPRQVHVMNPESGLGSFSATGVFYVGLPPGVTNRVAGASWNLFK